jgi:hypothetical protein
LFFLWSALRLQSRPWTRRAGIGICNCSVSIPGSSGARQRGVGREQALRGPLHHYGPTQTPVLVTYHPAYLLRSPREKAKSWEDLKRIHRFLAERT